MRALYLWGGLLVDLTHSAPTEEERADADALLWLLTPVIKGYLTDKGFEATVNMQQVFGGHGYIREWGMEQFVRDARIAQIYEGTNGVQAMDLVGRKLAQNGGRGVRQLFETVAGDIAQPGNFRYVPGMTVMHALALAGASDRVGTDQWRQLDLTRERERLHVRCRFPHRVFCDLLPWNCLKEGFANGLVSERARELQIEMVVS